MPRYKSKLHSLLHHLNHEKINIPITLQGAGSELD